MASKRAAAKLKAKALVKAVARNDSRLRKLAKISSHSIAQDWRSKPIVGLVIEPTKDTDEPFLVAPQFRSTSPFRRHYEASLIERLKLRQHRTKLLFGLGQQNVAISRWGSLRQDALRKLAAQRTSPNVKRRGRSAAQRSKFKAARVLPDGEILANIDRLQSLLGLSGERAYRDVTFVSIDCEFGQNKGATYVTEIGISTLKASDIIGIPPGLFMRDWNAKLKHHHLIVNYGKTHRWKEKPALFAESQNVDGPQAKAAVQAIMRELGSSESYGYMALVGHSTISDIEALRNCPDLQIDIRTVGKPNVRMLNVFDTYWLGLDAKNAGADMPGLSLGSMANSIGVDPVYCTSDAVLGWHNASNDAAYTMMCLLLFAADWNVLTGKTVRSAAVRDDMRRIEKVCKNSTRRRSAGMIRIKERPLSGGNPIPKAARRRLRDAAAAEARASLLGPGPSSWWSWLTSLVSSMFSSDDSAAIRAKVLRTSRKKKYRRA